MERREKGIFAAGLVITAILAMVNIYVGGIALIILIALALSFQIMGETYHLPDVICLLAEDARAVVLMNRGNDTAFRIHLALVPLDREFDLPELAAEARQTFALPAMIAGAKAVVTFENSMGRRFSRVYMLSATGPGDEDILKPTFPLFGWK